MPGVSSKNKMANKMTSAMDASSFRVDNGAPVAHGGCMDGAASNGTKANGTHTNGNGIKA